MSDRILELSVEAERLADEATNAFNDETGNWICTWNEVYDQKFAELIIRECCQHLTNIGHDSSREQLEKHFGVE